MLIRIDFDINLNAEWLIGDVTSLHSVIKMLLKEIGLEILKAILTIQLNYFILFLDTLISLIINYYVHLLLE